jgi:large subunit ribosomal protein L3
MVVLVMVKNLKVYSVDTDKGLVLVTGAVPGRRGTLLEIRSMVK